MTSSDALFELVRRELLKVAMPGVTYEGIVPDSLLIEQLGVDSLRFVDLTLALENALQVDEFPMQAWVDECLNTDQALTVRSLVAACRQVLRAA